MNTYVKYAPNVFVAKCSDEYQKGEVINVTTKYGKDNECVVHNLVLSKDGYRYYSITRADGYNLQERAKAKAERYQSWAGSASEKSNQYYEASQEGKDFLALAEPIKVGHHSEKRHRALIERNWGRMGKCVEYSDKADQHISKAEYWEKRANDINLSMPESLEYYIFKLDEAKTLHEGIKSGKIERRHSMALQYANKDVKELTKKVELATRLWA